MTSSGIEPAAFRLERKQREIESSLFRDMKPCSLLKDNRRFGGTSRLILLGRSVNHARNQREAGSKRSQSC
jgi:hypothetical protein